MSADPTRIQPPPARIARIARVRDHYGEAMDAQLAHEAADRSSLHQEMEAARINPSVVHFTQAEIDNAAADLRPHMPRDGKLTNPKDHFGSAKLSTSIVPDTLVICAANGFLEGALKYGRYNWRIAGVRASIYVDALRRHVAKWWNGQECDVLTTVHHLDNAIACLGIMRDAMLYGMLEDDRPPCPNPNAMADLIDEQAKTVAHLKLTFASHQPYQYTIKDTPQ